MYLGLTCLLPAVQRAGLRSSVSHPDARAWAHILCRTRGAILPSGTYANVRRTLHLAGTSLEPSVSAVRVRGRGWIRRRALSDAVGGQTPPSYRHPELPNGVHRARCEKDRRQLR